MLTAKQFQKMLGVADFRTILYGYTFERQSVIIFFVDGKIVRLTEKELFCQGSFPEETKNTVQMWEYVVPEIFRQDIKRWYANGTRPKMRHFMESFFDYTNETEGGHIKYNTHISYK